MSTQILADYSNKTNFFDKPLAPWIVTFSASLFFFYIFIQINMLNSLAPALFQSFHLTSGQIANLSQNYFYANVLFLFPAGILLDRFSTRKIVLFAMTICIIATLVFAFSHSLLVDDICRFMTGLAGAFCLLAPVRIATRWFPPHKLALVIGLIVTFAMIGGMVAQTPFTYFIQHIGWRHTIMGDALLGLIILIIMALFVKDTPPNQQNTTSTDQHHISNLGFWKSIGLTLGNRQNWLAGLYASLINLPIFLIGALFGNLYLQQTYHFSAELASSITMMMFVGMIIGSPAFGWFSDKILNRKIPMILGAIFSLAVILIIMYAPNLTYSYLMTLFFLLGFMISSQIIAYPVVAESNPESLTGTAEGVASFLIMSGGFMMSLFSVLLTWHWNHLVVNNVPLYSPANYHQALMIMPIAFAISLVLTFFIKETNCRSYTQRQASKTSTN